MDSQPRCRVLLIVVTVDPNNARGLVSHMAPRSISSLKDRVTGNLSRRGLLTGAGATLGATAVRADDNWWDRALSKPSAGTPTEPARQAQPIVTKRLDTPDFAALHPSVRFVAGIRPVRGGGMRIAYGKPLDSAGRRQTIVHNYGHGGAGLSLAFGAAETARDLVTRAIGTAPRPQIAILGAGVIGLTTARALLERHPEASLTLYAKHINAAETTSYWAGGQFALASSLDEYTTPDQRRFLVDHLSASEQILANLKAAGQAATFGIAKRTAYSLSGRGNVRVLLGENTLSASQYSSWLIDPVRLLPALRRELEGRGVVFVARSFESRADLGTLLQSIVVNCTGAGSAALFDDTSMRPCRGHLVILQNPGKLDYFLNSWCSPGRVNHIFARHDDIVLGGSIQWEPTGDRFDPDNGADVRTCERILRNARSLFEPRGQGKC